MINEFTHDWGMYPKTLAAAYDYIVNFHLHILLGGSCELFVLKIVTSKLCFSSLLLMIIIVESNLIVMSRH